MSHATPPPLSPVEPVPTLLGRVASRVRWSLRRINKRRRKLLARARKRRKQWNRELKRLVCRPALRRLQARAVTTLWGAEAAALRKNPKLLASRKALNGGARLTTFLREWCALQPDEAVLEIGCGGGGPALALTEYLDGRGRYEGLDIIPDKILHARAIITKDHPNFRFQVADVYNQNYNPRGRFRASEYRFPFPDSAFDVVLLGSVFTHMRPADVDRYLAEIARVSKRGGRSLITYFLLNSESSRLIETGVSVKTFAHNFDGFRAEDGDIPERAIAHEEEWVRGQYAKHRLEIQEPIRFGSWCGRDRSTHPNRQDIVVAVKP